MSISPEVVHAFGRSELFACCDPGKLALSLRRFSKNSAVPNAPGNEPAVGLVVRGRVQVYSVCVDGTAVNLSTLRPGDSFGISNIFSEDELSTILVSDRDTAVAYIPQDSFYSLLEQHPQMLRRYLALCNRKIHYLTKKIEFLTTPSCKARLISYLLKNRRENLVRLDCSKEQLAQMLGVSRASLFRELKGLCDDALIRVEGRRIELLELPDLERTVQNIHARQRPQEYNKFS